MVMEAATLSNPQRKFNVVPVQKSLSLPSYARAGGEGIDHQLIFAALEQKEKIRRKSKIFTREKSSRQTVFCLPLPTSSNRCRETSLSSDTSCSSLEYQKPLAKTKKEDPKKKQDPKANNKKEEPKKKEDAKPHHRPNDYNDAKLPSIQPEPPKLRKDVLTRNAVAEMSLLTRRDPTRLGVAGSSDSMDRSSRSSNDSLGRREWLVAVKARVEAAREKIGNGSSSEEEVATMTRYNSDGLIHKSGRDSATRPSRYERRVRRRSQDEVALKKLSKKSNDLSLCLVDAKTANHLEVKTDFCPSPNVPDVVQRKNYFSDYPSRESAAKTVQARIRHIEDEERKRRSGSDFLNKFDPPSRQSPLVFDNNSPAATESRRTNGLQTAFADAARSSPIPRSSQAPTPPPRSPKSITFVNKAFLQHQMQHESSLERKRHNNSGFHSKLFDQFSSRSEAVITPEPKLKTDSITDASEKQKIRELICSRRKTCGNFDFMDENMFSDLTPLKASPSSNATSVTCSNFPSVPQIKKLEGKGYFSSSEMHCSPIEDPTSKLWKTKWQENDQRREYMFNSLESKRKFNTPSWSKYKNQTSENDIVSPQSFPNYKSAYTPKEEVSSKSHLNVTELINQLDSITQLNSKELSSLNVQHSSDRLSKSEANIALKEKAKLASEGKENNVSNSSDKIHGVVPTPNNKSKTPDKISATANLESAMEELESVYQSLKISSDNLSDKGNTSNSLDDKDLRKSKFAYNSNKDEIGFKRRSSVCESSLSSLHIKSDFKDLIRMTERKHNNPMPDLLTCLTPKESITEQLSIDEMFDDLTQQLDFEQKLLKDPRDNKTQTKVSSSHSSRFPNPRPSNPQPSQISIRKEFFDNLSKGHQDQTKRLPDSNEPQPPPLAKKKYKAVRSLSENISMLMATATNPTSSKHNSAMKTALNNEDHASKTVAIEQYYERARDPSRRDLSCKSPDSINPQNTNSDEIRHIRVSMDTAQPKPVIRDKLPANKHYARLSSAVCSTATHISPKQESSPDLSHSKDTVPSGGGGDYLINSLLWDEVQRPPSVVKDPSPARLQEASPNSCNSKDTSDVLEEGLEKLLNRLLGDVPERPQSSLLQSSDVRSPTPPSGKLENVKFNWNILPSKMDIYAASNAKNKISSAECKLKNERAAENAQRITDYRQNNNGIMNQMSFIPVYTKKTNMCHNYPKSEKNKKETDELEESNKAVNVWHSPPVRQKCLKDQTEKMPGRTVHMYARRRSVGFEDMTSTASNYGYNLPYEKRHQVEPINSNLATGSVISRNRLDPEVDLDGSNRVKEPENRPVSALNSNAEVAENENSLVQVNKSSDQLKDKSSKRKSSLNRIDFVDFPPSCSGKIHPQKSSNYNSNSSSDEGSGSKSQLPNSEFLSTSYKRKHNSNQSSLRTPGKKATELASTKNSSIATKVRANVLPKTLQSNPLRVKHHKRIHSATAVHLQKFSHSAGELETLTDASEVANTSSKICLSAQEFDAHDSASSTSKRSPRRLMPLPQPGKLSHTTALVRNTNENASHIDSTSPISLGETGNVADEGDVNSHPTVHPCTENAQAGRDIPETTNTSSEQLISKGFDLNGSLDLKHIDSRSEDESDLMQATSRVENLDISSEKDEQYISAEENYDPLASDSERRPSSILRRKQFEEKRELHGILKPPPANEKQSRTPPSILKHRESSEEKDVWQQGDLHSILKKSTSEEESCNSGPDIRPILKVSTDEESPSGSMRPRPILKKRTSFSEECSYASYPNSDLKPILKKKTPLSLEEQPRPILKSRRKSEDARSSLSEFVASRPRAYSADMGVKGSLEDLDVRKENLSKPEYHDL